MELHHAHWIAQANGHWKEHQQKRHRSLSASGMLPQALRQAAESTATEMETLRLQGLPHETAWEMVREQHLFPPAEADAGDQPEADSGYALTNEVNQALGSIPMPGERAEP
jgi:superoxide dismutase